MLRLLSSKKSEHPSGEAWAANRHCIWCGIISAELSANIDYFLPGFSPTAPFVILPETFIRKVLFEDEKRRELMSFLSHEPTPTPPEDPILKPGDLMESSFLTEIFRLGSLPDTLFLSPEGSFFLEVEISEKDIAEYNYIFDSLKSTNYFVLYVIKDASKYELMFNLQEWHKFPASARDRHADRAIESYKKKLQDGTPISPVRKSNSSVRDELIDKWNEDAELAKHVAFLRIDRKKQFETDRKEAAKRLMQHFERTTHAFDSDICCLYEKLKPLFSPFSKSQPPSETDEPF